MRRSFRLDEVDCANCAAKMERAVSRIDGVSEASVSFMTQRLTIETDRPMDEVLDEAQKKINRIESGCRIIR